MAYDAERFNRQSHHTERPTSSDDARPVGIAGSERKRRSVQRAARSVQPTHAGTPVLRVGQEEMPEDRPAKRLAQCWRLMLGRGAREVLGSPELGLGLKAAVPYVVRVPGVSDVYSECRICGGQRPKAGRAGIYICEL